MSRCSPYRAVVLGPVLGLVLAASAVGPADAPVAASTTGPLTVAIVSATAEELSGLGDLSTPLPSVALPGATIDGADPGPTATVSDPRPLREQDVTALGTGFTPGEEVTASLPARLRGQLGTALAGADGTVSLTVQAPMALQAGAHEVLLRGTSGATASTSIQLRPLVEDQLARLARWWPRG